MRWSAAQSLSWIIKQEPLPLREWTSDMGPNLKDAQKRLAGSISAGEVQAWGRKQPQGLVENIPNDPFRIPGVPVIVGEHGDMRHSQPHKQYDGPRWHSIEFDANQIKKAFPKPPPASANGWMLQEAERLGGLGKRDIMVQDCMGETGCTKRAALAAYKNLPEGRRRKRGKPPKNFG
jgi:hypothetical protein